MVILPNRCIHLIGCILSLTFLVRRLSAEQGHELPARPADLSGLSLLRGDLNKRLEQSNREIDKPDSTAKDWALRSQFLLRAGRIEDAEEAAAKALQLNGRLAEAHFVMALIREAEGKAEEAAKFNEAGWRDGYPDLKSYRILPTFPIEVPKLVRQARAELIIRSLNDDDPQRKTVESIRAWRERFPASMRFYSIGELPIPMSEELGFRNRILYIRTRTEEREFRLHLDTGAWDASLVTSVFEESTKLRIESHSWGMHGWGIRKGSVLPSMWIGSWKVRNIPVDEAGRSYLGLGLFVVNRLCVGLDLKNDKFVVWKSPLPSEKGLRRTTLPILLFDGHIYLRVKLANGRTAIFIFDTGATATFLDSDPHFELRMNEKVSGREVRIQITDIHRKEIVPVWKLDSLEVVLTENATLKISKTPFSLNLLPLSQLTAVIPDGILGADIFSQTPLKKGCVWLDFDSYQIHFDLPD